MRLTLVALVAAAVVVGDGAVSVNGQGGGQGGGQVIGGVVGGMPVAPPPPPPGVPPQNRQLRTGNARIAGRVVTGNGQPLRQAMVRVTATELNGTKTTTTDQDGRYEILNLPAGRYTVSATKTNYLTINYGQAKPGDIGRSLALADNQQLDGINLTVPRGSVIAGRVTDEFGEPATDVQVVALQKRMSQGQLRLMPSGRTISTNDIGEFRLYGLSPGQYFVSVTPRPNFVVNGPNEIPEARTGYAPTYYPSTTNSALAQGVTVGLGETVAGLDMQLQTMPLATISGTTIDSQGAPLTVGSASAMLRDGSMTSSFGGAVRADGTFMIASLPPGEYLVRAVVPQRVPARAPGAAPGIPTPAPQPPDTLVATVTVNGTDVTGVVLTPLKRITIYGRVSFDGAGSANLRSGLIQLMLSPRSQEAGLGLMQPMRAVRDDFSFEFQAPAAELLIRANVGAPQWAVKVVRVGGVDITDIGVDLRAGRDLDGVEVVLTSHPAEVSGTVTDARGEPQLVPVIVFPQDRDRWIFDSRLIATARPDQTGRYRLRALPPGRYFAAATDGSMLTSALQDPEVLESLRSRATAFTLAEGEVKTVDLRIPSGR